MMETRNDNHQGKPQNHFFNGLLVGLLLGFGLALLFTTKKGRRMLRTLTEEGLDSISELRKRLDTIEVMIDENDEYVDEEPLKTVTNGKKETKEVVEDDEDVEPLKQGSKRRLFKGISKKN